MKVFYSFPSQPVRAHSCGKSYQGCIYRWDSRPLCKVCQQPLCRRIEEGNLFSALFIYDQTFDSKLINAHLLALTCNTGTSSQLVPASSSHWQIQSHPSISIARCITKIFSKLSLFKMTLLTVKSFSGSLFLPLPSAPQCWRSLELLFQISPLSRGSFKSLSCHLTNVNYNDFITTLLNIGCFYLFFLNERPFSIIQWNRDDVLKQNCPS